MIRFIKFLFVNIIFFLGICSFSLMAISNFFTIISVETCIISINLSFLFYSAYAGNILGLLFVYYLIIVSTVEVVVILSYFIVLFKRVNYLDIEETFNLKY